MDLIELKSPHGCASVSLQGAQVLSAELHGQALLWLSPLASREPGKAVRGGVPLCFPWFGKHPQGLQAHGFARNLCWTLLEHEAQRAVFELCDSAATRALWPHAFRAELAISLSDALQFDFSVQNRDENAFDFSYALHSYLAVSELHGCAVQGLDGRLRREVGHVTTLHHGPVRADKPIDALFDTAEGPLLLQDGARQIAIDATDMRSAVVWNPGAEAQSIADIGPYWTQYLCVERGNLGMASIHLPAGGTHRASMSLQLR